MEATLRQRQIAGEGEADPSELCESQGILAITETKIDTLGWSLPGEGKEKDGCGEFGLVGCLNKDAHFINSGQKKPWIRRFRKSCDRRSCPICVESWSLREARSCAYRMKFFKPDRYRKPVHVVLAPSQSLSLFYINDVKKLRKLAYTIAANVGIVGGLMIFHGTRKWKKKHRYDADYRSWSPHFHALSYGWISNVGDVYDAGKGWYVKNIGVRTNVVGTVSYLLSHATFRTGFASVVWFGELGYRKLKVAKEDVRNLCPICNARLLSLEWYGEGDPPEDNFSGFYDREDCLIYEPKDYQCKWAEREHMTARDVRDIILSQRAQEAVIVVRRT